MPVTSVGGVSVGDGGTMERAARRSRVRTGGAQYNEALMWGLMLVVALSPLPLGSNRPFFWSLSSVLLGTTGICYFGFLLWRDEKLRVPLSAIALQAWGFAAICAFLVFQLLPLAAPLSLDVVARAGDEVIRSSSISIGPGVTFLMLLRMATYGLFFFLMLQLAQNERRREFMYDLILGVIVAYAAAGLIALQAGDTILGLAKWAYLGSATGTFVNRNSFATFLAFGACIAGARIGGSFANLVSTRSRGPEALRLAAYAALYALLVTTVLATQSRMGFFVTVTGSLLAMLLVLALRGRLKAAVVVALPLSLVALAIFVFTRGLDMFERLGGVEQSADVRLNLYYQIVDMIAARPWTGFGGGTFDLAYPLFHRLPVNPDLVWDRAHNTYLALWSELGLVAGSLPILMIAAIAVRLTISLIRGTGSLNGQTIALAVIVVGAIHSLVDFSLEIQANTFAFLALVALGLSTTISSRAAAKA